MSIEKGALVGQREDSRISTDPESPVDWEMRLTEENRGDMDREHVRLVANSVMGKL